MDTVEEHEHEFPKSEWPFSDPENVVAISTVQVFRQGFPILRVSHDYDGDWQVLCGTTVDTKDAIVVCLGCAYQKDKSIAELADLPLGWTAWRDYVGGPWEREQKAEEDDDEGRVAELGSLDPMPITDQQRKLNDERVRQDIQEFGCHVISVIDPDEREPSFTYSVGIKESAYAPDAIVFGVRPDLGAWLINEYKRQVQRGARFVRGTQYEGFLEGFSVYFEPVRRKRAHKFTLGCTRYYGNEEYEVVQIVYPTVDGVWPWQRAASEWFVAIQPMLGRLRPDRP